MKIPQTKRYSIYKNLVLQDKRSKKLNFEPDGREHYVYRITDYTRSEKEHYYGSHTPRKDSIYNSLEEEFWTYKTSSKYNVLNENKKEQYKIKILKVFDNPADKMIYEAFLHQYFDVKLHTKFWNESNQTPFGFDNTGKDYSYVRKSSGSYENMRGIDFIPKEVRILAIHKCTITKRSTIIDGKDSFKRGSEKAAKTMKIKQKDGLSIYEKAFIKQKETRKTDHFKEKQPLISRKQRETLNNADNGESISVKRSKKAAKTMKEKGTYEESGKKQSITKRKKATKYQLYDINNEILADNIIKQDIIRLYHKLIETSENKRLGFLSKRECSNSNTKNTLRKKGLEFLIGSYIKESSLIP